MCGITGFWTQRGSREQWTGIVTNMMDSMVHRGPDDGGYWIDSAQGLVLGHRRLAILDLTQSGSQPKGSRSGRFTVVFNGEIYNFKELRSELLQHGAIFDSHSDTEVLLAGFDHWGVDETIKRSAGMFALGVWDKSKHQLILARDRIGEKPLYYGWLADGTFAFASELQALRKHPGFDQPIDRDALALFMRLSYIPAPYSIYAGIRKLAPGHILRINDGAREGYNAVAEKYWQLQPRCQLLGGAFDAQSGAESLEFILRQVVREQMVSDVSLGAFLSGGIDSSLIVALMQSQSMKAIKTFTIGFQDDGYDESRHAQSVATHLGTDHTLFRVTAEDALAAIPMMGRIYDEPFADSSQIPTYLVAKLARRDVTVALSGDGGDEIFGGYNRYIWLDELYKATRRVPSHLRPVFASGLAALPPQTWDRIFQSISPALPKAYRHRLPGQKIHKLSRILGQNSISAAYLSLLDTWFGPSPVLGSRSCSDLLQDLAYGNPQVGSSAEHMGVVDMLTYLPDDIMVKVDRAAMAVSLESRAPFLDHRVVEFAANLPDDMKIHNRIGKIVLRNILYKYVPKELIERPKMGFAIPLGAWLRAPLRGWAEDLLSKRRLVHDGFLDVESVSRLWQDHCSTGIGSTGIWNALMFQSWLDNKNSI